VRFLVVVEVYELLKSVIQLDSVIHRMQVYVVLFYGSPEPFNKNVVSSTTLAVHTDFDLLLLQVLSPKRACELTALVRIDDLRLPISSYSLLQDIEAVLGV